MEQVTEKAECQNTAEKLRNVTLHVNEAFRKILIKPSKETNIGVTLSFS